MVLLITYYGKYFRLQRKPYWPNKNVIPRNLLRRGKLERNRTKSKQAEDGGLNLSASGHSSEVRSSLLGKVVYKRYVSGAVNEVLYSKKCSRFC